MSRTRTRREPRWARRGCRVVLAGPELLEARALMTTGLIRDIDGVDAYPDQITAVGGWAFFEGLDPATGATALYRGGGLVKDVGASGSGLGDLTAVGSKIFFNADDGTHGNELWVSDGTASGTAMVRDLNASGGSYSSNLTNVGGTLFFTASDGTSGVIGLWKSDGTTAGTTLVKAFSSLNGLPSSFTALGGKVFFTLESSTGSDLYVSDGTSAGTVLLKEFARGSGLTYSPGLFGLTALGGTLLFAGNDGGTGPSLWKSDGTTAGTTLVKAVAPDPPSTLFSSTVALVVMGGSAYFTSTASVGTASSPSYQVSLWKTDGTAGGTSLVSALANETAPGALSPGNYTSAAGKLYFTLGPSVVGGPLTLWGSDGTTAGTIASRTIRPPGGVNDGSTASRTFAALGGSLIFSNYDVASGLELWRSDGTVAGTALLADLVPGTDSGGPQDLTLVAGALYFSAHSVAGVNQLWTTNGTAAGTLALISFSASQTRGGLDPYANSDGSGKSTALTINGKVVFAADDGVHGLEPWVSDGTTAGTSKLLDLNPGPAWSLTGLTAAGQSVVLGGFLYFVADLGYGPTLLRTDGTTTGTSAVAYLGGTAISDMMVYNGALAFARTRLDSSGKTAVDLMRSDGTTAGTTLVKSFLAPTSPFTGQGPVLGLTAYAGKLFFAADDGLGTTDRYGNELWSSDGTTAGTTLFRDINATAGPSIGTTASSNPAHLAIASGILFFSADDGVHGPELWATNGSPGFAVPIADINATAGASAGTTAGSNPSNLTVVGGRVFFVADDGVHGPSLWVSDGYTAHTLLVQAASTTGAVSGFASLTALNGLLVYLMRDASGVWRPWASDGTAAGTFQLSSSAVGSPYTPIVQASGVAYFGASDSTHGAQLWKTDGTVAGTTYVVGAGGSNPSPLAVLNGTVLLADNDGVHGSELTGVVPFPLRTEAILGDYDGDGKSDISIYDPVTASFLIRFSSGFTPKTIQWGYPPDQPIPLVGDFDGDKKTDLAVYDPVTASFIIGYSSGKATQAIPFGIPADKDIPVNGDYDGDGKTDLAVYDPVLGEFLIGFSSGLPLGIIPLGDPSHHDIPVASDYDGDGKTDPTLFDPVTSTFLIAFSSGLPSVSIFLGDPTHHDIPLNGDYDGDGRTDLAVYNPATSSFLIAFSSGYKVVTTQWGLAGNKPTPVIGDYDGDKRTDISIYDPVSGTFIIAYSSGLSPVAISWGTLANSPIPGARYAVRVATSPSPMASVGSTRVVSPTVVVAQVLTGDSKRRRDGTVVDDGS